MSRHRSAYTEEDLYDYDDDYDDYYDGDYYEEEEPDFGRDEPSAGPGASDGRQHRASTVSLVPPWTTGRLVVEVLGELISEEEAQQRLATARANGDEAASTGRRRRRRYFPRTFRPSPSHNVAFTGEALRPTTDDSARDADERREVPCSHASTRDRSRAANS